VRAQLRQIVEVEREQVRQRVAGAVARLSERGSLF
jgi:hypothetical protein